MTIRDESLRLSRRGFLAAGAGALAATALGGWAPAHAVPFGSSGATVPGAPVPGTRDGPADAGGRLLWPSVVATSRSPVGLRAAEGRRGADVTAEGHGPAGAFQRLMAGVCQYALKMFTVPVSRSKWQPAATGHPSHRAASTRSR